MEGIKLGDWVYVDSVLGKVLSMSNVTDSSYRCVGIREDATQQFKVITDYKEITKVNKNETEYTY